LRYYLVCTYLPTEETEIFSLRSKRIVIGRGTKSTPGELALPFDASLSRRHCWAQLKGAKLEVGREQGKAPLLVSGIKQERFFLKPGESFRSANCEFQFVAQGALAGASEKGPLGPSPEGTVASQESPSPEGEVPAQPQLDQPEEPVAEPAAPAQARRGAAAASPNGKPNFTLSFEQLCKFNQMKRFFEMLTRLSRLSEQSLAQDKLLLRFLEEFSRATPEVAALLVVEVAGLEFHELCEFRVGPVKLAPSRVLADQALNSGEPIYHSLNLADRHEKGLTPTMVLGFNWMMAAPIVVDKTPGSSPYLLFAGGPDAEEGEMYCKQGKAMTIWLTEWLAQHLRFAQLKAKLENNGASLPAPPAPPELASLPPEDSSLDPLTEVSDRRTFFEQARELLDKSAQKKRPFSLITLGVDDLRDYNRIHGYRQGDRLLRHIGQVVRRSIRPDHVVGRLGGGEFAVATPQTLEVAWLLAETLREAVETQFLDEDPSLKATVSGGLGGGGATKSLNFAEVLNQAERSLSTAKHEGGNKILPLRSS
jgi:diguanylate cyclase (GGDEF)-like protein